MRTSQQNLVYKGITLQDNRKELQDNRKELQDNGNTLQVDNTMADYGIGKGKS